MTTGDKVRFKDGRNKGVEITVVGVNDKRMISGIETPVVDIERIDSFGIAWRRQHIKSELEVISG